MSRTSRFPSVRVTMTMSLDDFIELARYCDDSWRGYSSLDEIKENAKCFYDDMKYSIRHRKVAHTIQSLINNLKDDVRASRDNHESYQWLKMLVHCLMGDDFDMDFEDYI